MAGGIGYAVDFGEGVVSFWSPCVLPLVPVYPSVTTRIGAVGLAGGRRPVQFQSAARAVGVGGLVTLG